MIRRRPLCLERLEDRYAPATFGVPWPDPGHLTLSFVPDGTDVAGQASELFRTLNAQLPAALWQEEVLRAFQTWAVNAPINISVVTDGGEPLGSTGVIQGDPRFGDIRIAAVPMSPDVVAVATPFDVTAGTWSGDVRLNSRYDFGIAGLGGYDLFTVMLHEAGHVFGLDENTTDPTSAMYEDYSHPRTGLAPADIASLQALYGVRTPDATNNSTLATATLLHAGPDHSITADGDLAAAGDVNVYQFQPPSNSTNLTVRLETADISLLTASLTVFDDHGKVVGSAWSLDPLGGDLQVSLNKVFANRTYFVQVEGSLPDVFGIGSYRLHIDPVLSQTNSTPPGSPAPTGGSTSPSTDPISNDTLGSATSLQPKAYRTDGRFNYAYQGTLYDAADVDFFQLKSPKVAPGAPDVLTVMVWGLPGSGLDPTAVVYQQATGSLGSVGYQPVAANVLVNDGGTYVVQIPDAVPGAQYDVEVRGGQPPGAPSPGGYFLGIDFGAVATPLDPWAAGTLAAGDNAQTLQINQSQLLHFVLSGSTADGAAPAAVRMTICDPQGRAVAPTLASPDGGPVSANYFLLPGTYAVVFSPPAGAPAGPVSYRLQGVSLSDPIGPEATDPTDDPVASSTAPSQPYLWSTTANFAFLSVQGPASAPQWDAASLTAPPPPTSTAAATSPAVPLVSVDVGAETGPPSALAVPPVVADLPLKPAVPGVVLTPPVPGTPPPSLTLGTTPATPPAAPLVSTPSLPVVPPTPVSGTGPADVPLPTSPQVTVAPLSAPSSPAGAPPVVARALVTPLLAAVELTPAGTGPSAVAPSLRKAPDTVGFVVAAPVAANPGPAVGLKGASFGEDAAGTDRGSPLTPPVVLPNNPAWERWLEPPPGDLTQTAKDTAADPEALGEEPSAVGGEWHGEQPTDHTPGPVPASRTERPAAAPKPTADQGPRADNSSDPHTAGGAGSKWAWALLPLGAVASLAFWKWPSTAAGRPHLAPDDRKRHHELPK